MNVIQQTDFIDKCTGCSACYNICPVSAINMEANDEGFNYPTINNEKCIQCGKCLNVCAIKENYADDVTNENIYSFVGDDNIRNKSSSGGLFYYLAKNILDQGGIVFGAAFDKEKKAVVHCSTDSNDLFNIMRSKYVQSDMGTIYKEIKKELNCDRKVLFCGTPCQVYGLHKYFGGLIKNLYLVDFVCHGVPSPGFLKRILENCEKEEQARITDITFREKDLGWRKLVMKFYFENDIIRSLKSSESAYYRAFLENISLRKSCYTCHFPSKHYSDLTIFDHWLCKNDDNNGTSAVMINTDIGQELLSEMPNECIIGKIRSSELLDIFTSHDKIKAYKNTKHRRNTFFEKYKTNDINYLLEKWLPHELKSMNNFKLLRRISGKTKRIIKRIINVK